MTNVNRPCTWKKNLGNLKDTRICILVEGRILNGPQDPHPWRSLYIPYPWGRSCEYDEVSGFRLLNSKLTLLNQNRDDVGGAGRLEMWEGFWSSHRAKPEGSLRQPAVNRGLGSTAVRKWISPGSLGEASRQDPSTSQHLDFSLMRSWAKSQLAPPWRGHTKTGR